MRALLAAVTAVGLLATALRPALAASPTYLTTVDGPVMVWPGATGTVKFATNHPSGSGSVLNVGVGESIYVTESTPLVCQTISGILYPRKGGGLACVGAVRHLYLLQAPGYGTRILSTFGGEVTVDADPNTVAVQFGAVIP